MSVKPMAINPGELGWKILEELRTIINIEHAKQGKKHVSRQALVNAVLKQALLDSAKEIHNEFVQVALVETVHLGDEEDRALAGLPPLPVDRGARSSTVRERIERAFSPPYRSLSRATAVAAGAALPRRDREPG